MRALYEEYREGISAIGTQIVSKVRHVVAVVLIQTGPGTREYSRLPRARSVTERMRCLLHGFVQCLVRHRMFGAPHRAVEHRPSGSAIENAQQSVRRGLQYGGEPSGASSAAQDASLRYRRAEVSYQGLLTPH